MKYLILALVLAGCTTNSDYRALYIPIEQINYGNSSQFDHYVKQLARTVMEEDLQDAKEMAQKCKVYSECLGQQVKIMKSGADYGCYIVKGNKRVEVINGCDGE